MNCAVIEQDKIYVGDVGTAIILDTEEDLTDASAVTIEVRKPNGKEVTWTGAKFETTKVKYVIVIDDLDQSGKYHMQTKVITPTGSWRGGTVPMEVYKKWK